MCGVFEMSNHAHLGKNLEDLLNRTHAIYLKQKRGKIEKNPVEWRYTSESQYRALANGYGDIVAITNRRRFIKKVKSDVDFSGHIGGKFVIFDAKETSVKNLPLSAVTEAQLRTLREHQECGSVSGLMVMFSALNRLFFITAAIVDMATIAMLYKKGPKSIPLVDFESFGVEIPIVGNLADWAGVFEREGLL